MNRNELIAQLAAETSTTRAAVERMAGAVFSAIGDALARGEPAAIARGSGRSPCAAAPRAVAATCSPNRRARRHRRLPGAVVQGREGPSRPGQRLAWRRRRPATGHVPRRWSQRRSSKPDEQESQHRARRPLPHFWTPIRRISPIACVRAIGHLLGAHQTVQITRYNSRRSFAPDRRAWRSRGLTRFGIGAGDQFAGREEPSL